MESVRGAPTCVLYEFAEFRLVPAERMLLRNGEPVGLTQKAFETLLFMVENSGRVVAWMIE